jgi:hypothetical protein
LRQSVEITVFQEPQSAFAALFGESGPLAVDLLELGVLLSWPVASLIVSC